MWLEFTSPSPTTTIKCCTSISIILYTPILTLKLAIMHNAYFWYLLIYIWLLIFLGYNFKCRIYTCDGLVFLQCDIANFAQTKYLNETFYRCLRVCTVTENCFTETALKENIILQNWNCPNWRQKSQCEEDRDRDTYTAFRHTVDTHSIMLLTKLVKLSSTWLLVRAVSSFGLHETLATCFLDACPACKPCIRITIKTHTTSRKPKSAQ